MPRRHRQTHHRHAGAGRSGRARRPAARPRPGPTRRWPALAGLALLAACGDGGPTALPTPSELIARYGLEQMPEMRFPPENLPDPLRIELGRLVFFDPVQSGGRDVACATCHLPRFGFTDGRELPAGPSGEGLGPDRVLTDPSMEPEARNSPTIINVGFNRFGAQATFEGFMFWDGRKRQLENLVLLPQLEFTEMRGSHYPVEAALDTVLARLRAIPEYEERFREAFPDRAGAVESGEAESAIDSLSLASVLSQFVRSVTSTASPYDRFVAGDPDALSRSALAGLVLFHDKAGCVRCHAGPLFSDFGFHVVGARQQGPGFQETPHEDFGRWNVTRLEADRYRFRTPSLRNVELTAPYTHAGAYATLEDMVRFFDRGGGDHPFVPGGLLETEPLGLGDREVEDLVAFLRSLTDAPQVEPPQGVPSGLPVPR